MLFHQMVYGIYMDITKGDITYSYAGHFLIKLFVL